MKGVRKVEWLDPNGNIHVALTKEVDLDDLMLELAASDPYEDNDWRWEHDPATSIPGATGELDVTRWRCNPCACGDYHAYDVAEAHGKGLRGSYLGLMGRDYIPTPYVPFTGQMEPWSGYHD